MSDDQYEHIVKLIENVYEQNNTVKALILSLAAKTGFDPADLQKDLASFKSQAVAMDPGPSEVDPEV